jgi:Tol biopolymer transport system component/DNA-binding winged helix-turn-helix (wHTH) protein
MTGSFRVGDWQVEPQLNLLKRGERAVHLEPKVMDVLCYFAEHGGEVRTKERLIQAIWPGTFVTDEVLTNAVSQLRKAFEDDPGDPRYIRTIPRRGYQLVASVQLSEEATPEPDRRSLDHQVRPVRWAVTVVGLLVAAAVGWYWLGLPDRAGPRAPMSVVPLTSYPGYESNPSFSPDGESVVFEWCRKWASECDIFIKQIDVEPPVQLTKTAEVEAMPAWSPDGRWIAFLRELPAGRIGLIVMPSRGGSERLLAELDYPRGRFNSLKGPRLSWTPDSRYIAAPERESGKEPCFLWLFSVENGERRRLTQPPREDLWSGEDDNPAFSPDGRTLAFSSRRGSERWRIHLLRLGPDYEPAGVPEVFSTGTVFERSPTWTPDGRELLFVADPGVWRKAVSSPGKATLVQQRAVCPAISPRGNRLAYSEWTEDPNIWQVDIGETGRKPTIPTLLIGSTWEDYGAAWSPDGGKIALTSHRSGRAEVWLCEGDGSKATRLSTELGGYPQWSPDGQEIVFETFDTRRVLHVIRADGGSPRSLSTHWNEQQLLFPNWSRDGRWIYFRSTRSGRSEIWKIPAAGGDAIQVTKNMGDLPQESPDGRMLYYTKGEQYPTRCTVWGMPTGGGPEAKVLDSVDCFGLWAVAEKGIYYVGIPDGEDRREIRFYEFATGLTRVITRTDREMFMRLAVSPDQSSLLFTQIDYGGMDLMLVEDFR